MRIYKEIEKFKNNDEIYDYTISLNNIVNKVIDDIKKVEYYFNILLNNNHFETLLYYARKTKLDYYYIKAINTNTNLNCSYIMNEFGDILYNRNNIFDALVYYKKAIKLNNYTNLEKYNLVLNEVDEYEKKLIESKDINELKIYATKMYNNNNYNKVKVLYEEILIIDNNNNIYENYIELLEKINQLEIYENKIINERNINELEKYALYLYNKNNLIKSKVFYEEVNKLDNSNINKNYINIIEQLDDIQEIKNLYDKILIINNSKDLNGNLYKYGVLYESEILYKYGVIYEKEENIKEAKKKYIKAIELKNTDAMLNYAKILEKENKISKAKKYYDINIEIGDFNIIEGLYNYGKLLENENKIEEAKKYYIYAASLNNIDAILRIAKIYEEENKYDEAEKLYKLANNIKPESYEIISFYINFLIKKLKIDKLNYLIKVIKDNINKQDINELFLDLNLLLFYIELIIKNTSNTNLEDNNFNKKILLYILNKDENNVLANRLMANNSIDIVEKIYYYKKAINLGDSISMFKYSIILFNANNINEAKIYILNAIKLNNKSALKYYLQNIEKSIYNRYDELKSINSSIAKEYIKYQEDNNSNIKKYIKTKNVKIDTCYICFEENIEVINYKCNNNHYLCRKCYNKVNKCPFCRL